MKKIILGIMIILAIAMFIATKANISSMTKKNISFKNVEALAAGETSGEARCTGPRTLNPPACLCTNSIPCEC